MRALIRLLAARSGPAPGRQRGEQRRPAPSRHRPPLPGPAGRGLPHQAGPGLVAERQRPRHRHAQAGLRRLRDRGQPARRGRAEPAAARRAVRSPAGRIRADGAGPAAHLVAAARRAVPLPHQGQGRGRRGPGEPSGTASSGSRSRPPRRSRRATSAACATWPNESATTSSPGSSSTPGPRPCPSARACARSRSAPCGKPEATYRREDARCRAAQLITLPRAGPARWNIGPVITGAMGHRAGRMSRHPRPAVAAVTSTRGNHVLTVGAMADRRSSRTLAEFARSALPGPGCHRPGPGPVADRQAPQVLSQWPGPYPGRRSAGGPRSPRR